MRRAARVDANHTGIVQGLRKAGCSVLDLARMGKGCPDMLVGFGGLNILREIKDGDKPPSARKLTADEAKFHRDWKGMATVVNDLGEALKEINEMIKTNRGFKD